MIVYFLMGFLITYGIFHLIRKHNIKERNKRIDLIFQIFQDPVEEAYKKDPDIFKKMFAGVKPLKNIPKDIFKK